MRPAVLLIALGSFVLPDAVHAQRPRWLGGGKPDDYVTFKPADERFAVDVPKRDWRTVAGAGSVLVVFSEAKSEASVALEHIRLKQSLEPGDITQLFVDLEVESVKERDASADGFRTDLRTDAEGRRIIVIDFTHTGLRGPEQVRQFSLPWGSDLFRLICSAAPTMFERYAPLFDHMAGSFKLGPGTSSGK